MNIERESTLRGSELKVFSRAAIYLANKGYKQRQNDAHSMTFTRGSTWRSMFSWSNPGAWPCTLHIVISKDPNYDSLLVKSQFSINTSTQAAVLAPEREFWDREVNELENALLVDDFEPTVNKVSLRKVNLAVFKQVSVGVAIGLISGILVGALVAFLAFLIVRQFNWSYEDARLLSLIIFVIVCITVNILIVTKRKKAGHNELTENKP